jgi:hypothetical protein
MSRGQPEHARWFMAAGCSIATSKSHSKNLAVVLDQRRFFGRHVAVFLLGRALRSGPLRRFAGFFFLDMATALALSHHERSSSRSSRNRLVERVVLHDLSVVTERTERRQSTRPEIATIRVVHLEVERVAVD